MIDLFTENDDAKSSHSFSETKSKASDLEMEEDTRETLFNSENRPESIFSGPDDLDWNFTQERFLQEETDLFGQPKFPNSPNHETTASENFSCQWNRRIPQKQEQDPSNEAIKAEKAMETELSEEGSEKSSQETLAKYVRNSQLTKRNFKDAGISMDNINKLKRQYYSNFDYKAYIDDYLKNIGKRRVRVTGRYFPHGPTGQAEVDSKGAQSHVGSEKSHAEGDSLQNY